MFSIPNSKKIINLLLSKTQRKTPTVLHKQFSIEKIRQFYGRKIKYIQQYFDFFIRQIIKQFPIIDQLHPFFGDLFNILFNRNNYKIALNHLNNSRFLVSKISASHLQFLKYGTSLYNCKQIKKTALGKICKSIKKLEKSLLFLEKIRLQLKKIPKIDPHRKTIMIGGSSGTGKSSLMNKITRASVIVNNGTYTSKNLYLGHLSVNFFQWQVIDSPGITVSNFFNLNSFEIQTINAYINLNCLIIYLIDFSLKSKISHQKQFKILFRLRKLIKKKKKKFMLTKTDLGWEKRVEFEEKSFLNFLFNFEKNSETIFKTSCHDEIGLLNIREKNFFSFQNSLDFDNQKIFKQKKNFLLNCQKKNNKKLFQKKLNKLDQFESKNNIILPQTVNVLKFKNYFSEKKVKTKKETDFFRENKIREFLYEKIYASREIRCLHFYLKKDNNIKIYPKILDFWHLSLLKI